MPSKIYWKEFAAAMLAYALVLTVSLHVLNQYSLSSSVRIAVALLPMLPAAAICWVVVRQIGRMDELQRKIQFEAVALAFTATAFITFGYGFLVNLGFPSMSAFAVWPLMASLWLASSLICRLRYT